MNARKKILIALSGGVDSAVSAALLKKQGFDVFGVHFRFIGGESAKKSLSKAKKVAEVLKVPLKIVDARADFKKNVIDYFIASYKKSVTPNPCVVCNRDMKFDLLFKLLEKYGADFIATGHYARLRREIKNKKSKIKSKEYFFYKLLEARDDTKDQSYFLYKLTQRELAKIIFPLGNYKKSETKKLAKKFKLPVLGKEESQDVCFLLDGSISSFLKKYIKTKSGNITDENGNKLATHKGLPFYTIGQRKGIEIGGMGPYFVVGKNPKKNELIVSNDPKKLLTKKFEIREVNWINKPARNASRSEAGGEIEFPLSAKVQIRYHSPKISAKIKPVKSGKFAIETEKYLRAVTPGQSAVFYKNGEVLGGGTII